MTRSPHAPSDVLLALTPWTRGDYQSDTTAELCVCGGQFTSLTYSRVTDYLPAHGLLSALLIVKLPEHWTAEVYGNNLTDRIYRTGEGLNSGNYDFYGAPRQYGLRATYDL